MRECGVFVRLFGFFGGAPLRIRNVAFLVLAARCLRLLLYISAAVWELLWPKPALVRVPNPSAPLNCPLPPPSRPDSISLGLAILCIFAHTFGSFWQSQRSGVPAHASHLSLSPSPSLSLTAFLLRFFCGHKMLPGPKNEIWAQVSHIAHRKR